jgi:uncharacterized membrane protein
MNAHGDAKRREAGIDAQAQAPAPSLHATRDDDRNTPAATAAGNESQQAPRVAANRYAALGAFVTLAALTLLCLAWEWRLAPLRPGGSALVLKALPLAIALPGVLRRQLYTLQWASMLVLVYFAEGIVRGMTDAAPDNRLGWLETALALGFFVCALAYVAPFKRAARGRKRAAQSRRA